MALHKHKGKWYCDASDLDGLKSVNALKHLLSRARQRGKGPFQNVPCPHDRRKKWVLIESLPVELRKQLEADFWQASLHHEDALRRLQDDEAPPEEIAAATQITSAAVLVSQPLQQPFGST